MKTLKLLLVGLALGTVTLVALTRGSSQSQDFQTPDGSLVPTLAPRMPGITRATLEWRDTDAPSTDVDLAVRAKIRTETDEWVRRVIVPDLVPKELVVKTATLLVAPAVAGDPVAYDGSRVKFIVPGGALFVTQTAGFMTVVFKPDVGSRGAASASPSDMRRYLEAQVQRFFQHTPAMLHLATQETLEGGYALVPDMRFLFPVTDRLAEEVHALDTELPYPAIGGFHSFYWGSYCFATDGMDVIATFNKVQGGAVFAIDRPRW
jgi:hypothetical protein